MQVIIITLLLLISLFALGLQRAYQQVPLKELRRRARQGDPLAASLYRAAGYGYSLRWLLLSLSVITTALVYVYVARVAEPWFAAALVVLSLWFMYIWLPAQTVQEWMVKIAAKTAPAISWLLQYLHPVTERLERLFRRLRHIRVHTGLFEEEDIVDLLERQREQSDNRIPESTIHVVQSALTFSDKPIREVYTPRRVVHSVSVDDAVGPVLLSELHDSGFSRFPVYEGAEDNIVGILHLRDLVDKKRSGKIRTYMKDAVCYIHEEQTLRNGLDAILKTHQQLFIVVNSFEEYVGVVSIEDILEQVLGEKIVDEFDAYEDMRAVALSQANKDRVARNHPAGEPGDETN
jgi:CBS domain containing-hemolysin-like protein